MALILTNKYGTTPSSLLRFWLSRLLRIYPTYLICLATLWISVHAGVSQGVLPITMWDWLINIAFWIPTLTMKNSLALGVAYTLGLEDLFYLIAPFLNRLTTALLLMCLIVAVTVHTAPVWIGFETGDAIRWQYDFFPGILVYFLLGTLSYRALRFAQDQPKFIGWIALALLIGYSFLISLQTRQSFANSFFPESLYLLGAATIPFIFATFRHSKADRFIGELSYPLYLVHLIVIGAVHKFPELISPTLQPWIAIAVSLFLSVLLVVLVERPINKFRQLLSDSGDRSTEIKSAHQAP